MKYLLLSCTFIFCMLHEGIAADDFMTLLRTGKVTCSVKGNEESVHYAKPLTIQLTNRSGAALDVLIPAGFVFKADDSIYQDILVTQRLMAKLQTAEHKGFALSGMCLESHDSAPSEESGYKPKGMAEPKLVKLAEFIEQKGYFSPAGQNAVWAYVNNSPLYTVSSLDTSQSAELTRYLAELTGKKPEEVPAGEEYRYNYTVKPAKVVVGGEVEFNFKTPIHVEWGLYNEEGILLRELHNGNVGPGKTKLSFNYDAEVYSDPVYYLKLVKDGEVLYNRKLSFDDDK